MENIVVIADATAAAAAAVALATAELFASLFRSNYRFLHAGFSMFSPKFNGQHTGTQR